MTIRHVSWSPYTEHFIPQAVLAKPPSFFEKERNISFVDGEDGLDLFRGALLLKDGVTPIVLKQYRGKPQNQTTIYLSPDCQDLGYISRTIEEVVADLGLAETDIVWQRKDDPSA
jgi:hypothetical protein